MESITGGQVPVPDGADALKAAAAEIRTPEPGIAPASEAPKARRGGARPGAGRKPRAKTAADAGKLDARAEQLMREADAIRESLPPHKPEDFTELARVVLHGIAQKTTTAPPSDADVTQLAAALVPLADRYMPHVIARVGPGTPLLIFAITYGTPRAVDYVQRKVAERRARLAIEDARRTADAIDRANNDTGADLGNRGTVAPGDGRVVADAGTGGEPHSVRRSRSDRAAAR